MTEVLYKCPVCNKRKFTYEQVIFIADDSAEVKTCIFCPVDGSSPEDEPAGRIIDAALGGDFTTDQEMP